MNKRRPIQDTFLVIMRVTLTQILLMTIFASLVSAAELKGQEILDREISLQARDKKVKSILKDIEKELSVIFTYRPDLVKVSDKVSIKTDGAPLREVLEQLFSPEVEFIASGKEILLTPARSGLLDALATSSELPPILFEVRGTTLDENGNPLPGVNILEKGTTSGVVSDAEGKYRLDVTDENAILTFSFIGYQTQEVPVNGRSVIDLSLEPDVKALEEVVVVGYGTQKKINLTGSVSSVGEEQLSKRSVTQASQLLQGVTSGLTATQTTGEPGEDAVSLAIRGLGTFSGAGTEPLVLVDGVPTSINSVNPNDIESISVLKDAASAAIYGSRAANGVILIQTKSGEAGSIKVSYDTYVGKREATELPEYVDSWTYAEMKNEARINMGQNPEFTQEQIELFRSGTDPYNYPNKHHLRDLFTSGSGLQTKHNLTVNGGSKVARYLFSTGYLKQNGIIEKNEYDRYDLRLNVETNLRENLRLNAILSGNQSLRNRPAGITTNGARVSDLSGVIQAANSANATIPGRRSDGTYGTYMGHPVPDGHLASGSFSDERNTNFGSNISLEWDILESLKIASRLSYRFGHSKSRLYGAEFVADPNWSFGPSQANVTSSISRYLLNDVVVTYGKAFGSHDLRILGGFSNESYSDETLTARRDNFPSNMLQYLSAASPLNDENGEVGNTWKLVSYFGRLNYAFKDKYLFEGNLRYDGSSRFSTANRFGVFPSFSAAWNISEEAFFEVPWIEHLKIRASYGKLGNQQIGTYPYQKILTLGSIYATGDTEQIYPGVQLTNLPFEDITWESTKVTNAGIEFSTLQGKLNLTGEYYYKRTENILYSLSVSSVLGMTVGAQNAGEVENKGYEFEVTHKNALGDLSYSIFSNFSINRNKVLGLAGVPRDINKGLFIGESMQSIYGYKTDGLFVNEEDIANYATQNYNVKPGFPRFRDLSGPQGTPDGIIDATNDRTIIGNRFPRYSYGMGITAEYKGFDFYLQLQGQAGLQKLIQGKEQAFNNNGNIQQWHVDNRWTEENPDPNAAYPRLEMALHEAPWDAVLDYWLRDASFIRIKTLQLGYNLSPELLNNTFIDQVRVYISGENLKSFDRYYPGWDPEMTTTGGYDPSYYPVTRMWSLGVNIQF